MSGARLKARRDFRAAHNQYRLSDFSRPDAQDGNRIRPSQHTQPASAGWFARWTVPQTVALLRDSNPPRSFRSLRNPVSIVEPPLKLRGNLTMSRPRDLNNS